MKPIYVVHIVAGSVSLIAGYIALFAGKGALLHRKAGMVFVYAILTMCIMGFVIAVGLSRAPGVNAPAAVMTAYFVVTSLTTVRPAASGGRWLLIGGMIVAFAVAAVDLGFGVEAIQNGGRREGIPAFPFFLFGTMGLLASAGDFRVLRNGALVGARRLARHLWRMTFALLVASMSFFFGQAKVIPKPIRIPALLAIPPLLALAALLYWMWRVRVRRSLRGMVGLGTPSLSS